MNSSGAHRMRATAAAFLLVAAGCSASTRNSQLFLAEDPETGERAVYRLSIEGAGGGGVKYYFTAAYLPTTAVDLFDGKLPESLAEIDARTNKLSEGSAASHVLDQFHDYLKKQADKKKVLAESGATPHDKRLQDEYALDYGRLMARAMLSASELRSIGESESTSPIIFRKLVYFVSTRVLRIADFDAEIKDIENSIDTLANTIGKVQAERRARAEAKKKERQAKIDGLKKTIESLSNRDPSTYKSTDLFALFEAVRGFQ